MPLFHLETIEDSNLTIELDNHSTLDTGLCKHGSSFRKIKIGINILEQKKHLVDLHVRH